MFLPVFTGFKLTALSLFTIIKYLDFKISIVKDV